jgi:sigma-B regulation protein RsbU (phosphoserine phosphatase)
MTRSNLAPLHRLLKRREIAALLGDFEGLLPGRSLALIGANGRLFAGSGEWSQAKLEELLAQASDGQTVDSADLILQPLLVESQLMGVLVARRLQRGSGPGPTLEEKHALHCLHRSLMLLMVNALETRDVVGEAVERYREINLLYHIGETIGTCLDPEEVPKLVLREAKRFIQAEAGMVLLPRTDTPTAAESKGGLDVKASFGASDYAEALQRVSDHVIGQVYHTGQPAIVTPPFSASPVGEASPIGEAGEDIGAILCVPLKMRERTLGVILLGRPTEPPVFTAGDEKLLLALGGQAAIAIETVRLHLEEIKRQRLEEELAIGRQIQLSLLPEACPVVSGWEFAAVYQAARQAGGDLYDFFELPDQPHRLGLVIADVTGKGVPAALFMAFSRTVIRAESMTGRNPAAVLEQANRLIVRDSRSRLFLSAFYATLDTHNGRLVYANGGHNQPLWLRGATGECQELTARSFILGMFRDIELEKRQIDIAPGDLLIFYTDGVTEARDASGQLFGEERLWATLANNPDASAQQVLQAVIEAVKTFTGDIPQSDDLTLFVVKRQKF